MTPDRAGPAEGPAPAGTADAEPVPAHLGEPAMAPSEEPYVERFPRNKFLELSTLGIGGIITGIVALPVAGFAILPAFTAEEHGNIDLGPLDNFPEGEWREAHFLLDPAQGEVTRRTAFVRYNGLKRGLPSVTLISNRCVHLGCPVQAGGPRQEDQTKTVETDQADVTLVPIQPANFSCPCHGGAYDTEGNRTAGPPVRALDRYEYGILDGNLVLLQTYSVGKVKGEGANALIVAYGQQGPGEHVDGIEALFYPIQPQDLE
jgi:menaquinol-cytochrome c reductase iron-sulfur subunit